MSITVISNEVEQVEKPVEQKDETKSAPVAAKATEQKESTDSETVETEVDGELETEEESGETDESESEKPKKKGGFQRRIDKLNARYSAAQAEIDHWKAMALKGAGEAKPEAKVETKAEVSDDEPNPDSFETHGEYVKAVTKWAIDQDRKAAKQEQEKAKVLTAQEEAIKAHHDREKSFIDKTEDYKEVVKELLDSKPNVSPAFEQLVIESENGPEILYALAKDRKEFDRVNSLSPLALAREIGRIEAKISKPSSEETKPEPKKITKAPQPIAPVGSKGGVIQKNPDDMTMKEFEQWYASQKKA